MATSEPVVHHHGREGGFAGGEEVRPTASTACWAAPNWCLHDLDRLVVLRSMPS